MLNPTSNSTCMEDLGATHLHVMNISMFKDAFGKKRGKLNE